MSIVTAVNYFQATQRRVEVARGDAEDQLRMTEWLFGSLAGRSYVPSNSNSNPDSDSDSDG
ncbi:MAG: hypothetical protein SV253_01565 [Halobacteria archaeon]|nr:hypothetical protein [Halobacteria archaeon]